MRHGQGWIVLGMALALAGCGERVVTQEVVVTQVVTQVVEVTREVPVEVTVEVTREVPVEVTVVAIATAAPTATVEVAVLPDASATPAPETPTLATTVAIVEQGGGTAVPCWSWQEAPRHVGETGCVEGIVSGVGGTESVFFINFSPDRTSFYGVSFDWEWEELAGECVRLDGTISEFRGRSQLIIDDPVAQVHYCGSADSPPAFER